MTRQPRQTVLLRNTCKFRHLQRREQASSAAHHVDARIRRGRLDVERLALTGNLLGNGPRGSNCAAQAWGEDGTVIDRDHPVLLSRGKSHLEQVMRAAACMEHSAPAPLAMRIDQIVYRALDPELCQRVDDERALPFPVTRARPVLEGASPTNAEMRTNGCDAFRTRGLDLQEPPAVGMSGPLLDLNRLSRQCIGQVNRDAMLIGAAIAPAADARNRKPLTHDELR